MGNITSAIAIYYEHPDWFRPLFAELNQRAIPYLPLDASCLSYDVMANRRDYTLLFNRMSASAYLRGHELGIFFTRDFLAHLERTGTRVIAQIDFGIDRTAIVQEFVPAQGGYRSASTPDEAVQRSGSKSTV